MSNPTKSHSAWGWLIFGAIALVTATFAFFTWYSISQQQKRANAMNILSRVWAGQDAFLKDVGYYAETFDELSQRQKIGDQMVGPHLEMPDKAEGFELQLRLVDLPESMQGPGKRREATKSGKLWEVYLPRGEHLDGNYLMPANGAIYFNGEGEATTKSEMILPPR